MSTVDGIVLGAFGMALLLVAGYFIVKGMMKTWAVATSMEKALKAVPRAVEALERLEKRAAAFQEELQYMRAIASGQDVPIPNFGVPEDPTPQSRGPVPYPAPFIDRFPIQREAPDAEPEDGVSFAQTDAEMAEDEKLENLIDAGLAYREEIQPKGREVEST